MILTHLWKIEGYLTKMFYHFVFRKLDVRYKTTKNFVKNKLLRLKLLHPHFSSPINIKAWHYVMLNVPVSLGGNLIFLHREEAHSVFLPLLIILEKLFLQVNNADIW